jgi:hypothetical protein
MLNRIRPVLKLIFEHLHNKTIATLPIPHEEASEKDKDRSKYNHIGRWDDIRNYIGI